MELNSERPATSPSSSLSWSSSTPVKLDPLLEDLSEARQKVRRNVVSIAAELKVVRSHLASTERCYIQETLTRQEAEAKANALEEEVGRLQKSLEERNGLLSASTSTSEKYLQMLDELSQQLTATQGTADACVASAQTAQLQWYALLKELDAKNHCLMEHEDRVQKLAEQLDNLLNELKAREFSQKQLKDKVMRAEHDIMEAVMKAGMQKDSDLQKLMDEVSPKNLEKINKLLTAKDDEITKLKDEIRILTAHWKLKSKEMESQLEKNIRADQELKKRVLKLEFCLQEARSQTRKLQRVGERRDRAIKELKDQLSTRHVQPVDGGEKQKFWESQSFKVLVSMSMLILVVFSKR